MKNIKNKRTKSSTDIFSGLKASKQILKIVLPEQHQHTLWSLQSLAGQVLLPSLHSLKLKQQHHHCQGEEFLFSVKTFSSCLFKTCIIRNEAIHSSMEKSFRQCLCKNCINKKEWHFILLHIKNLTNDWFTFSILKLNTP